RLDPRPPAFDCLLETALSDTDTAGHVGDRVAEDHQCLQTTARTGGVHEAARHGRNLVQADSEDGGRGAAPDLRAGPGHDDRHGGLVDAGRRGDLLLRPAAGGQPLDVDADLGAVDAAADAVAVVVAEAAAVGACAVAAE